MSNGMTATTNALGREYQIAHGSGQMRAQSISIQLSDNVRCNAGCLFCISRTTPGSSAVAPTRRSDAKTCDLDRLRVGLNYARTLGATHAVLTGRADPTQEALGYLTKVIETCREFVPLVDMHTNGFLMGEGRPWDRGHLNGLRTLVDVGLTMITFSIASFDREQNRKLMGIDQQPEYLIRTALDLGLMVRCSLVVTKNQMTHPMDSVLGYIVTAGSLGAHAIVVREVWVPDVYGNWDAEVYGWNKEHKVPIRPIQDAFIEMAERREYGLRLGTPLPWGTPVFLMDGFSDPSHGVNVTFSLCEEANVGSVVKSIVHKPNGHGYRNWDHNGDILY